MSLCATGCPLPALLLGPFLTLVPRSLPLNREETLATRAMADRESGVALCHGVALKKKKKRLFANRENGVSLSLYSVEKMDCKVEKNSNTTRKGFGRELS